MLQTSIEQLQTDFDLDMKGLDMLFLVPPDAAPQSAFQESYLVAAAPAALKPVAEIRKATYGVCEIVPANLNSETNNSRSLNEGGWMTLLLSGEMQERLASNMDADALTWYYKWMESFKVSIQRSPQYGRMANDDGELIDPKYASYRPNPGFVGQDRVDLLVEAKDDLGRPISMTIRYFINVRPSKEIGKLSATNTSYLNAIKKFCGTGKHYWRISESTLIPSDPSGQVADPLAALLTAASQNLTFVDLTGSAVGETTGTGKTAQIILDTDAAGHGWYIDYTPFLNEEYLPTSNPLEWIAKPGSEAEGKNRAWPLYALYAEVAEKTGGIPASVTAVLDIPCGCSVSCDSRLLGRPELAVKELAEAGEARPAQWLPYTCNNQEWPAGARQV